MKNTDTHAELLTLTDGRKAGVLIQRIPNRRGYVLDLDVDGWPAPERRDFPTVKAARDHVAWRIDNINSGLDR